MIRIKEIENYYALYEDTARKEEYERLLKKFSNATSSREFFTKNNKGEVHPKRKKLHIDIIKNYLDQFQSVEQPIFQFISETTDSYHAVLSKERIRVLPQSVKNRLKQLSCLKKLLE